MFRPMKQGKAWRSAVKAQLHGKRKETMHHTEVLCFVSRGAPAKRQPGRSYFWKGSKGGKSRDCFSFWKQRGRMEKLCEKNINILTKCVQFD